MHVIDRLKTGKRTPRKQRVVRIIAGPYEGTEARVYEKYRYCMSDRVQEHYTVYAAGIGMFGVPVADTIVVDEGHTSFLKV